MKKILFVIPTLCGRGAEKVLVNLANNVYDITILTLFDSNENKKWLKNYIKYRYIFKKIFKGNIYLLRLFNPKTLFKIMIKEKYDIIVSYLEGPTTRIVSGCKDSNVKLINWVHIETKSAKKFRKAYIL